MKHPRPNYCPETIKVFDKTFTFADAFNAVERRKQGSLIDPPNPPLTRQVVVYERKQCTTYVRIEQTQARQQTTLEPHGPWCAYLQDDYTHITGPGSSTVKAAAEHLELELSLVRDLVMSVTNE